MKLKHALRKFLTRSLYYLGISQLFLIIENRISRRRAVISLYYHNILDKPHPNPISGLEQGTVSKMFDLHVRILSKWLQPIDDSNLCEWLNGDTNLKRDGLLITFDDAYQDNLTVAGPILQKHQAPGLVFVATDYVETGRIYWWTRLSDAIRNIDSMDWKSLSNHQLPNSIQEIVEDEDLTTWNSRMSTRRRLGFLFDKEDFDDSVLDIIESVSPSAPPSLPVLSWDEIKSMNGTVFSFGNHTHTHPRLSKLTPQAIGSEVKECSQILFDQLGEWPCSIAYPAGDYDQSVMDSARATGIQLGFTTNPGLIFKNSTRMELPRISLYCSETHELYFTMVVLKLAKYCPARISRSLLKLVT